MLQKYYWCSLGSTRILDSEYIQNVVVISSNLVTLVVETLVYSQIKERFEKVWVLSFEVLVSPP